MCPGNFIKPARPIDVLDSVCPPVDVCKFKRPVDVCKPVCLVNIRKPFFVDYWRHVILFLILLLFLVSINTSVFNRTILYIIIFINIHVTYLTFTKFFKCACYFNRLFFLLEVDFLSIYF